MATLAELTTAIQALLDHPSATAVLQLNSNTRERAFEAYVFGLCCEAVRRAGGTATLTGIVSGPNPSPVVFRGAPGGMASTSQDFVYAACVLNGREFEVHVDVEYEGTSGAFHELDVSVVTKSHADKVRLHRTSPKASGRTLLAGFECKFYDSTPGVTLCRTFIGLVSDCPAARVSGFVANQASESMKRYLAPKARPSAYVVSPLDSGAEARFITTVEQALRKWAEL